MGRWRPARFGATIMVMTTYEPGTYQKGSDARVARSRGDAVALVFDGYKRVEDQGNTEAAEAAVSDEEVDLFPDLKFDEDESEEDDLEYEYALERFEEEGGKS